MKYIALSILALAAAGVVRPGLAAPLETYGKLPTIESVEISPAGAMLALTVTDGEQRRVVVEQIETGKTVANLNAGDQKVRYVQWAGPDHLIVTISSTGYLNGAISGRDEWFVATDFNIAKKTQRPLRNGLNLNNDHIHPDQDTLNVLCGKPDIHIINNRPFAIASGISFVGGIGRLTLFRVDLDRDATSIEARDDQTTNDFVVAADGSPLATSEYDAPTSRWRLKLWRGHWQEIQSETAPLETPRILGLGRDGTSLLVGRFDGGHETFKEIAPDGDAAGKDLPLHDPGRLIWDPASHKLVGAETLIGDEVHYDFFDPAYAKIWRAISAAFPGSLVALVSSSDNLGKFVVRVDSPTEGPAYSLVDLSSGKARWIGDEYLGLKPADVAPVRPLSFKAADGLVITGYITLPRDRGPKKLPLVVLPHGGPATRDAPGFDWWSQALASRGYAVLRVNYRGSAYLGWDFQAAGFGQWGRRMQTDLSDGVRYLAGQGMVDPARVCIVGASYGGYAALAGVTLDPGVYRCAASVSGPADLKRFVTWWSSREGRQGIASERYWLRYMGAFDGLDEISPARHADKADAPVLLIHGKDDTVVPFEQSEMMADALRKAGRPVELVAQNGEDHWLSRGDSRLQMLQAVTAFLERNNPP